MKNLKGADGRTYEDALKDLGLTADSDGHYVDNDKLYNCLVQYCKKRDYALANGLEKPKLDEYIGECILKIATHLGFRPNFANYSFRDEFVSDACLTVLQYIDSFNPEKSKNPFAYITQICWCAYIRRLKLERKQSVIKGKLMIAQDLDEEVTFECEDDRKAISDNIANIHTYMELAQEEENKTHQKKEAKRQAKIQKMIDKQGSRLDDFLL